MSLSYYAARANLYHLRQHHPDWSPAEYAANEAEWLSPDLASAEAH